MKAKSLGTAASLAAKAPTAARWPARSGDLKSEGNAPKSAGNNSGDQASSDQSGKGKGSGGGGGGGKERVVNDDDIVAKRLRKAAEEETDPELKERLWKEYNDYKKSAS